MGYKFVPDILLKTFSEGLRKYDQDQ